MTIPEAAAALSCSVACIRDWVHTRKIGYVKMRKLVRIPMTEIDRLITEGLRPALEKLEVPAEEAGVVQE